MCFFDILRAVHDQSGHKRSKVDTVANERDRHQGFDDFWLVFFFHVGFSVHWMHGWMDSFFRYTEVEKVCMCERVSQQFGPSVSLSAFGFTIHPSSLPEINK